jgi:hypothetical protein
LAVVTGIDFRGCQYLESYQPGWARGELNPHVLPDTRT